MPRGSWRRSSSLGSAGSSVFWLLGIEVAVGIVAYAVALRLVRELRPDEIEFFGEMWLGLKRRIGIAKSD